MSRAAEWTYEQISLLDTLADEGWTAEEIGIALGFTVRQVQVRARRDDVKLPGKVAAADARRKRHAGQPPEVRIEDRGKYRLVGARQIRVLRGSMRIR